MKRIKLAFGGSIYMENYGKQKEEDRIKIYDSDNKYLDYFDVETAEGAAERGKTSIQETFDYWAQEMSECLTIEDLLAFLNTDWEEIFPDKDAAMRSLGMSQQEFDNNEWINHIGKYYIKMYKFY